MPLRSRRISNARCSAASVESTAGRGCAELAPAKAMLNGYDFSAPTQPTVSRRDVMQQLWEQAGLDSLDTRVIRIPVVYSDFDDFWDSNAVPIGPQGKIIAGMSASAREELRASLRDHLPVSSDGRIVYESFANAVKGRVPE
jgi:allophanate hydrolase subunit 1